MRYYRDFQVGLQTNKSRKRERRKAKAKAKAKARMKKEREEAEAATQRQVRGIAAAKEAEAAAAAEFDDDVAPGSQVASRPSTAGDMTLGINASLGGKLSRPTSVDGSMINGSRSRGYARDRVCSLVVTTPARCPACSRFWMTHRAL
eukprot:COSAG02_NODE_9060_length_2345_cov_13.474622_5_plen_147_part_00